MPRVVAMSTQYLYLEDHRRRGLDVGVVLTALAVLTAIVLVRSGSGGIDLTPDGGWDWLVTVLALAAVPAWLVLGDGAFDGWSEGRGLAVGADRLLVDEVTFAFDELAPATMRLGPSSTATDGRLEVPLTEGGSVRVRPRDPARFTEALRDSYRSWAVQQDSRPGR